MELSRRSLLGAVGATAVGAVVGAHTGHRPASAAEIRLGIDYSWGRPRPGAVVAAGYTFVCRYLSWDTSGKNLTRPEADALRAAGLNIVSNWENRAREALDGYLRGVENALEADRQALACGMPAARPIYFSVDFDATSAQQPAIDAYFDGIASVIGRARTGAYGGYHVIQRLFNARKIIWGWQTYAWSGGRWDSRAQLRQVLNNITVDGAACDRDEAHAVDFGQWGLRPRGLASIYGVRGDGRLTFTNVDVASGARTHGAVTSSETLGFVPRAMATVNFNTVLVTSPGGVLHRVDISTNNTSLVFSPPVALGGGWTHDLLAYDGYGHLFGIAGGDGTLRRYTITAAKPTAANIVENTLIDTGFTLKTLTATGPDRILGTTSDGRLIAYHVRGPGDWSRGVLRGSTWQVFGHILSPGGGIYLAHGEDGSLTRYYDADPYNGSGTDIDNLGAVDSRGWTQVQLSAQPGTVA